jgi:lauroyl/myristoyl acyltransferase
MTQQVLTIVEEAIRADPGQWFWYNKRWILDPVGK